jgi:rubrerythrin
MSVNNDRVLKMLNTAREMEMKGHAFYREAVTKTENQLGRDVFQMLMQDETVHLKRIDSIFAELAAGRDWSNEWKTFQPGRAELGELFGEMAVKYGKSIHASTKDLEALDVGIDFEAKSILFYQTQLPLAIEPLEKEFLELMVAEEKTHHRLLGDMKLFLSAPDSYFQEKNRSILDGA